MDTFWRVVVGGGCAYLFFGAMYEAIREQIKTLPYGGKKKEKKS